MNTLVPLFLIGSSLVLQVTRTCVTAWMSLNFGKFATEIKNIFCIHIIIDRIYHAVINHCFLQICNRVTSLD